MKLPRQVIEGVSQLVGYFAGWLVLAMMALVLYEVFMRWVLNRPPAIADEFAPYLLVALSWFGLASTWRAGMHIRVTSLVRLMPVSVASWLRVATLIMVFAFVLILCLSSYTFVQTSFELKMASPSWLRVPLQVPHLTLPVGFTLLLLMILISIGRALANIRAGNSVEERL